MKFLPAIACIFAALLQARGDLVMVQKTEVDGKPLTITTKIHDGKLRTDVTQGDSPTPVTSTIFDLATGDSISINHRTKQFTKITAAQMLAKKEMALAALADAAQPADTGKKEKVGDYEAEIFTTENTNAKYTYWISKDYPDAAAVKAEMKKVQAMQTTFLHAPDLSKLDGVVVKNEVRLKGAGPSDAPPLAVTLVSAKVQPVDESEFQPPVGYAETDPPPPPPAVPAGIVAQAKYEKLDGEYSLIFTGTDSILYEGRGEEITGRYLMTDHPGRDVLVFLDTPRHPAGSRYLCFGLAGEGMLYGGSDTMLAIASAKEKAKTLLPDLEHRDQAELIAAYCRLYAVNHDGKFPKQLADLFPDYAPAGDIFANLPAQKAIGDYDYFGANLTDKDDPGKVLLRSKYTTSDGKNVEAHVAAEISDVLPQVKYESLDGDFSITFTGLGTVLYEGEGVKISGNYKLDKPPGRSVMIMLDGARPANHSPLLSFGIDEEGMLNAGDTMLAVSIVKEKAKARLADLALLGRAKSVADACGMYALMHDGKYPQQLADLLPDYPPSGIYVKGLTPKEAIAGYDYLGAGATEKDDPHRIILRSRQATPNGAHIVVRLNREAAFEGPK
ncbi:MAG TPA: DUF4412 domain-containing protein [Chthoniobacteraceae bacterium]|nr:DUF4412 domain-containing protein [Chthoniobacteraceae bacterium]